MASTQVALVIVSGQPSRIIAADTLLVGAGIASRAGTGLSIGQASELTTFLGNVQIDGTVTVTLGTTFQDDVSLGNDPTDDITFGGSILGSMYFKHEITDHYLSGRAPVLNSGVSGDSVNLSGATGAAAGVTVIGGMGGSGTVSGGTGGVCSTNQDAGDGGISSNIGGMGGAGSTTKAAGKGGDTTLRGGTAGADNGGVGATGGDSWVDGGEKTGNGVSGGLFIGIDFASLIDIGRAAAPVSINGSSVTLLDTGVDALILTGGILEIQTGFELQCAGTGMIDLPPDFKINDVPTHYDDSGVGNVSAANLDELTSGNATTLHSHTGGASSNTVLNVKCNITTAIAKGAPVAVYDVSGAPKGRMAFADGSAALNENLLGIAPAIIPVNTAGPVYTSGEIDIPDGCWSDTLPAVGNVGQKVYLADDVAGHLTLTPPSTTGSYVLKVGILTMGGTTAIKIAIQIGESFLLS